MVIKYAIRNLVRSPLRSSITFLSVALVFALYVTITSIGDTFTEELDAVLANQDIDIAVQARHAATPVQSIIPNRISERLTQYEEVLRHESVLVTRHRMQDKYLLFVIGITNYDTFASRFGFELIEGKQISDKYSELIVGDRLAEALNLVPTSQLAFGENKIFRVSGVYSGWLNFLNSGLIVDLEVAQNLTEKNGITSILFLKLKDKSRISSVVESINQQYPEMRAMESNQLPDFIGPIKNIYLFTKIISILTLVIASAVLLNTLIMSISERTKEIGILSAIGWSKIQVVSVLFFESIILSVIGGIAGFTLAFPTLAYIRKMSTSVFMYLPETPDWFSILPMIFICLLVSIISVLFPVIYTTRLHIATALKHE